MDVCYNWQAKAPPTSCTWYRENTGRLHDEHVVRKAAVEVEEFCRVLKSEGVAVRRPEQITGDQLGTFTTSHFDDGGQSGAAWIFIIIIIIIVYFRHKVHRNYNKTAHRTDRKHTEIYTKRHLICKQVSKLMWQMDRSALCDSRAWTKHSDHSRRVREFTAATLDKHLLLEGWSPSRTTARLQQKNHFRFHLTQLLLLFYYFLSTKCNLLRFQQPTQPVPDEVSILKLLQLVTACTAIALVDRQASGLTD